MKVGITLITMTTLPRNLFDQIAGANFDVSWYLHHHGADNELAKSIDHYSKGGQQSFFNHAYNRGVARSWNDGIFQSQNDGNDVHLVLNDDIEFINSGLETFIEFTAKNSDHGITFLHGTDVGGPNAGKVVPQAFACFAVCPPAIARVGAFDENFFPAYFEDNDYERRVILSGLRRAILEENLINHQRMQTSRLSSEVRDSFKENWAKNRQYFIKKWGAIPNEPGSESSLYTQPFNDPCCGLMIPWETRGRPYDI